MATSSQIKRSPNHLEAKDVKGQRHFYHHHHRLLEPMVLPQACEPVLQDDDNVDRIMNRTLGLALRDAGFELADPAALNSFRSATEEYLLHVAKFVRQSMLSSRRLQPIPQDFDYALNHHRITPDDLCPYLKTPPTGTHTHVLPPSPPPEDEVKRKLPFLNSLRDEESETNRSYVPKHFPDFPSKHTYSSTPVFTERDNDPRKIRERAAEDGRHGEEALRKLASAAYRNSPTGVSGRDKKLWGRRAESMETMFEKTIRGLTKKLHKDPLSVPGANVVSAGGSAMEIDSGLVGDADKSRTKLLGDLDMGPIVNCERDYWRRTTAASSRNVEDKVVKSQSGLEGVNGLIGS